MERGLSCEFVGQESDVVELHVSAWNGAFGGGTNLYVGIGALEDAASQLTGFPSHSEDTRLLLLGTFGPEFAGGAASLAFFPADQQGHSRVQVVIEADGEVAGTTETVTLALAFEPAALDAFIKELRRLEAEKAGVALLKEKT